MEKIIPIVLACDNNMADMCSVTISSIIANASEKYTYEIYIFHTRLNKENIQNLECMSKRNVKINCIDIKNYIEFNALYETIDYPYEMYYRFYASLILKYEKIIYLDCDTIAIKDVANLYNENLKSNPIGMVIDFTHYVHCSNKDFNSGVMLINTKLFEDLKIREKCIKLLKENTQYQFPDQTAINITCKDNIKVLGTEYNYQVSLANYHKFKKEIKKKKFKKLFLNEPNIIHFSYITKPYKSIYSVYNKQFWQYAKNSPYYMQLISKYLEDPYKVLRTCQIEDIYIEMVEEGKVGLKKIIEVLLYQIRHWFLYKISRGDKK